MKKKMVSLLLAAAVSAGAFGLVACGGDDNGDDGVLKSDKVATAAEWAAAFDFSEITNATVECNQSGTYYEHEYDVFIMKLDNEKLESIEGSRVNYDVYKADELTTGWDDELWGTMYSYDYDEEAKKWTYIKYGTERSASDVFKHTVHDLNEDFTPFNISDKFDDFTYDEKNYEYVATWDTLKDGNTTQENLIIKIKIKDGKIVEGSIDCNHIHEPEDPEDGERREGTIHCDFKIYDIGNTSVTPPEAEERVDDED